MTRTTMTKIGILAAVVAATGLPMPAEAHFQGYDSVDDGEIRYIDNTQYNDAMGHAVDAWNALGSIDIQPDEWDSVADVRWQDTHRDDVTWNGLYVWSRFKTDDIYLNVHYLASYTRSKRRSVAAHEQGHALGLDHSFAGQLMYRFPTGSGVTTPQSHDIADYDELWP